MKRPERMSWIDRQNAYEKLRRYKAHAREDAELRARRQRETWRMFVKVKHDDNVPALRMQTGPGEGQAALSRSASPILRDAAGDVSPLANECGIPARE